MSEKTRMEIWEQIKASELLGCDVVPLPIETVRLLLECARLVNEGAATKATFGGGTRAWQPAQFLLDDEELRERCLTVAKKL